VKTRTETDDMNDKPNYSGVTLNERLFVAGLLHEWDAAVQARDRNRMIELLRKVDLPNDAEPISDKVLANPRFYGF
jgi:hypothetical protein